MMHLLLRAIITGFGYKVGSELGRLFAEQVGLKKAERKPEQRGDDDEMPRDLSEDGDDEAPKVRAV
jgi:hypothetical protein